MAKWRFWQDEYWGDSWNDRREISSPEFEGVEIPDDLVESELLSYFIPEVRQFVTVEGDEHGLYATLDYCLACDSPTTECQCDDQTSQCQFSYIGYHATKVN